MGLRSHFAVGPFPRLCGFPRAGYAGLRLGDPANPLIELGLHESLTQQNLAAPPQRPATLMGFRSLQHTTGLRIHFPRALPARYVPPSGFGYPLDGLLPAIPCRFCFTPAALVGFTLRSFLLSKGIRAFPPGRTHLPFRPPVYPTRMHQAGSTGYGSWVLTLSEVPGDPHVFSTRTRWLLPWVSSF